MYFQNSQVLYYHNNSINNQNKIIIIKFEMILHNEFKFDQIIKVVNLLISFRCKHLLEKLSGL
jgi:hypothetical protein